MAVSLETYRSRIGNFNKSTKFNYKPGSTRRHSYKSSSRKINFNFIISLILKLILIISIVSNLETILQNKVQDVKSNHNSFGSFATASSPVYFFIIGGHVSADFSPVNHLSYHDILGVHSAATLRGVQGVQLERGLIIAALTLQSSILSDSNFYARYTYGNRSNRGIKLSHWNAGSAFLENKTNEIENVISDHHPHLLGISEANLHRDHNVDNCNIEDYDLITCKTLDNINLKTSRVVVYKHTSIVAKIRDDLMSDKFSSNWLEVGFPGKTKFLVCNLYREWQYLGQGDHSSLDISEQQARWLIFMEQWEKALDTGRECVVMGDFNLDFLCFHRNDLPTNSQAHRLKPLVDELFSRVGHHGVKQCVVGATRQGRVGQADTGLDHLWTNIPGRCLRYTANTMDLITR